MYVKSRGCRRIRFAGLQPAATVIGVSVPLVVDRHDVHQYCVTALGFEPGEGYPARREHSSAGLRDDHLRAEVVELVPEILGLEVALDVTQLVGVAAGPQTLLLLLVPVAAAAAVAANPGFPYPTTLPWPWQPPPSVAMISRRSSPPTAASLRYVPYPPTASTPPPLRARPSSPN